MKVELVRFLGYSYFDCFDSAFGRCDFGPDFHHRLEPADLG